jgi:hypothetical protein
VRDLCAGTSSTKKGRVDLFHGVEAFELALVDYADVGSLSLVAGLVTLRVPGDPRIRQRRKWRPGSSPKKRNGPEFQCIAIEVDPYHAATRFLGESKVDLLAGVREPTNDAFN